MISGGVPEEGWGVGNPVRGGMKTNLDGLSVERQTEGDQPGPSDIRQENRRQDGDNDGYEVKERQLPEHSTALCSSFVPSGTVQIEATLRSSNADAWVQLS